MNYSVIKEDDIADGLGVRVSIFVSGCHLHCEGCHNKSAWNFNSGKEYTDKTQEYILDLLSRDYINGLSILGGEPLADENYKTVEQLIYAVRRRFGNSKTIWLYTGYNIPTLLTFDLSKRFLFSEVNVIVDGPFIKSKYSATLNYRGSSNQMIRLVKKNETHLLDITTLYSDDTIDQIKDSKLLVNALNTVCEYKLVNEKDIPDIIEYFVEQQ